MGMDLPLQLAARGREEGEPEWWAVCENGEITEPLRGVVLFLGKRWIMRVIGKFCPVLSGEFPLGHLSTGFSVKSY